MVSHAYEIFAIFHKAALRSVTVNIYIGRCFWDDKFAWRRCRRCRWRCRWLWNNPLCWFQSSAIHIRYYAGDIVSGAYLHFRLWLACLSTWQLQGENCVQHFERIFSLNASAWNRNVLHFNRVIHEIFSWNKMPVLFSLWLSQFAVGHQDNPNRGCWRGTENASPFRAPCVCVFLSVFGWLVSQPIGKYVFGSIRYGRAAVQRILKMNTSYERSWGSKWNYTGQWAGRESFATQLHVTWIWVNAWIVFATKSYFII